jgi:hypothetical protein
MTTIRPQHLGVAGLTLLGVLLLIAALVIGGWRSGLLTVKSADLSMRLPRAPPCRGERPIPRPFRCQARSGRRAGLDGPGLASLGARRANTRQAEASGRSPRPASMRWIRLAMLILSALAARCSTAQNSGSRAREVAWPARLIERFFKLPILPSPHFLPIRRRPSSQIGGR